MPLLSDTTGEIARITAWMRTSCYEMFARRGFVLGVSGGVDSATVLHLAVKAVGPERVVACILPDRDSDEASARLASEMTDSLNVETITLPLTPALHALGCYGKRDMAIADALPGFDPDRDKAKIILPEGLLDRGTLNVFTVVVLKADGTEQRRRLSGDQLRAIVAASNMKQRVRMLALYHEAERRHSAVAGTANRNEADLGFFVKFGDGGVDLQPIAHLYKTEVYQIARALGVPAEIISRPPTTDTYSAPVTQMEFFYRLPFSLLDAIWCAAEENRPHEEIASVVGLTAGQVANAIQDLHSKAKAAQYLRSAPLALARAAA
jgi:NAD+ synthase